jgi:histidyl-tRNA synthetase
MANQKCKGCRDLLAEDMAKFRQIEGVFRECCSRWGYQEIRTPTLEYLHLFTSAGTLTPERLNRVYSFLDWDGWSGERVVLRPDGTIPTARLYVDNLGQQKLARLYYVENIFSFEEKEEQSRERWQCGAELIGSSQPLADAGLIMLGWQVLQGLKLSDIQVCLSHAGLLRALVAELGLEPGQQDELIGHLLEGDFKALTELKPGKPGLERALSLLLELRGRSHGFLKNMRVVLAPSLPGLLPSLDNFLNVTEMLTTLGCRYSIDIASGKGFEYYTGVMFQFQAGDCFVGGGGRYDSLLPLVGGGLQPASGLALYMDQLMRLIERAPVSEQRVLLRTEGDPSKVTKACFELAERLHQAGYLAQLDLGDTETNYDWVVLIRAASPNYILRRTGRRKSWKLASVGEVIRMVREQCS